MAASSHREGITNFLCELFPSGFYRRRCDDKSLTELCTAWQKKATGTDLAQKHRNVYPFRFAKRSAVRWLWEARHDYAPVDPVLAMPISLLELSERQIVI
jgi:hypothetical protein